MNEKDRTVSEPNECEVCGKSHDFGKEVSGWCSTCGRKYMCEKCCYEHECISGKSRRLVIIANPAWIMNLKKTLENEDRSRVDESDKD